jgi:hypothetical protein
MNLVVQRTLPRVSLSPREGVGVRGKGSSANPTFTDLAALSAFPRFLDSRAAEETRFLSPRKNLAELPLDLTAYLAKNILVGVYPIFREERES